MEPFGIYIHWPFCASKCPYCDFNSHVRAGGWDEEGMLAAYLAEMDAWEEMQPGLEVSSVFFGGGTPSLMKPQTVAALIEGIQQRWPVSGGVEITLEANPSSVEARRFAGYRAAGVNRVSLGVQALNDRDLRALGRLHSVAEAIRAVGIARATFERVSFDLIYARPAQSATAWEHELSQALSYGLDHLSLYQLTIEPGTPFAALHATGKLQVPEEGLANDLYDVTQSLCADAGLPAYEISNHARPGAECRHNLLYWRYGAYAGIGPGAHGRLVRPDGRRAAISMTRHPETWRVQVERDGSGIEVHEPLDQAAIADEALLMGLRIIEGIELARLERISGRRPAQADCIRLCDDGLLDSDALSRGWLTPTPQGARLLDRVVLELSLGLQLASV